MGLRLGVLTVIVVVAVGLLGAAGSCRPLPVTQPLSPTTTPAPRATALPTSTPQPVFVSPEPTVAPKISQEEAQSIVNAWFNSVLAQDYATASDITVGNAADRTRKLSEGFRQATGGNSVELAKQRVDLSPGPLQSDGSQAVTADFDVLVNQRVGPILLTVQRLTGSATFIVGRVGDRTRITDIRDVTGLPVAQ